MLPSPLHPAVVHFPVVLMVFLPLVAAGALLVIRRGARPVRTWMVPAALGALLALSAALAVRTGEAEEERLEERVTKPALESHEEAAQRFMVLSGVVVAVLGAGLVGGLVGRVARPAGLVAALALMVAGYQVGHTGGRLVYGDAATAGLIAGAAGAGDESVRVRGSDRPSSPGDGSDHDRD